MKEIRNKQERNKKDTRTKKEISKKETRNKLKIIGTKKWEINNEYIKYIRKKEINK